MHLENSKDFHFGLELEYLLIDKNSGTPLWHQDLSFKKLNSCFEQISLAGIPALDGLDLEPPHQIHMPFVVEGYHVADENLNMIDILPKGVEIRTPVVNSIAECLDVTDVLFKRMSAGLGDLGYQPVALSHHPLFCEFSGPQYKRRHDYWQWAMQVMTTYGPDINVSLPEELTSRIDTKDLEEKINYYAPAMAAFSVASPFLKNELWKIRNHYGKSFRSYKRSYIAPPIEIHPDEGFRLEFKVFEMSPDRADYNNFFLLFLTLLLDEKLKGRASHQTRIYDLGSVAQFGFDAPEVKERAAEILESAERTLAGWGFDASSLKSFQSRWAENMTPADLMIQDYLANKDLKEILLSRAKFA